METIRDMLSIGQVEIGEKCGQWGLYYWGEAGAGDRIFVSPREDEAWGVAELIIEYVEKHLYDPQVAIWAALDEYHQAEAEYRLRALDSAPTPHELAYQDHAHAMGYVC